MISGINYGNIKYSSYLYLAISGNFGVIGLSSEIGYKMDFMTLDYSVSTFRLGSNDVIRIGYTQNINIGCKFKIGKGHLWMKFCKNFYLNDDIKNNTKIEKLHLNSWGLEIRISTSLLH